MIKPSIQSRSGFTLIEMLVAISVFSILMLIVVNIFSHFVFAQRRDIGEYELQEELRLALELFNREVRTGFGTTYVSEGDALYFRNQNGNCVSYRLNQGTLARAEAAPTTISPADNCNTNYENFQAITSSGVTIKSLRFTSRAATATDATLTSQGLVTISLTAVSNRKAGHEVALQSTVTSRQITPYDPALVSL